jgi:glycosyltransferase involved in cell wall biosynthesis
MEKLIADDILCKQMGAAGRKVAVERFSLDVTRKIFLDKYDELPNGYSR